MRKRRKHLRPGAKIWNGVKSIVGVAALRREWETHKTTSPRCIVMTFTLLYHWSHEEKTQIITITTTKPTYYRNHIWPPIVVHHHSFSSTFIFVYLWVGEPVWLCYSLQSTSTSFASSSLTITIILQNINVRFLGHSDNWKCYSLSPTPPQPPATHEV